MTKMNWNYDALRLFKALRLFPALRLLRTLEYLVFSHYIVLLINDWPNIIFITSKANYLNLTLDSRQKKSLFEQKQNISKAQYLFGGKKF